MVFFAFCKVVFFFVFLLFEKLHFFLNCVSFCFLKVMVCLCFCFLTKLWFFILFLFLLLQKLWFSFCFLKKLWCFLLLLAKVMVFFCFKKSCGLFFTSSHALYHCILHTFSHTTCSKYVVAKDTYFDADGTEPRLCEALSVICEMSQGSG